MIAEVQADLPALTKRCDALVEGIEHVLVMGMGGSSLFPEVLARTLRAGAGPPAPPRPRHHRPRRHRPVRRSSAIPPRTLHLASSKSGSTIETRSHLEWAWARATGRGRFAVITDPGSELGDARPRARLRRGVREPARHRRPLLGAVALRRRPRAAHGRRRRRAPPGRPRRPRPQRARRRPRRRTRPSSSPPRSPPGCASGRDKVTYLLDPALAAHGPLDRAAGRRVARQGRHRRRADRRRAARRAGGLRRRPPLPLPAARSTSSRRPATRRSSAAPTRAPHGIGHMAVTMELAVALAGRRHRRPALRPARRGRRQGRHRRGARRGRRRGARRSRSTTCSPSSQPGDHLALQAFVDPGDPRVAGLEAARVALRDRHRVATSLGLRPAVPPLHRPAPQGRAPADRVRPGRRRRPARDRHPRPALRLRPPQAGPGRRRPAHPPGARHPRRPRRPRRAAGEVAS